MVTREKALELMARPVREAVGVGKRMPCLICQKHTVRVLYKGRSECPTCAKRWDTEDKRRREAKQQAKPWKWLSWKGMTVAVYLVGEGLEQRCKASTSWHGDIATSRLINLDLWCDGYTREQVKAMKSMVLDTYRREIPVKVVKVNN